MKSKISFKILAFTTIVVMILFLIPTNLVFGDNTEDPQGGEEQEQPAEEEPVVEEESEEGESGEEGSEAGSEDVQVEEESAEEEGVVELILELILPADSFDAGSNFKFKLKVSNTGTDDAANVSIQADIPVDISYVSDSAGGIFDEAAGSISWNADKILQGEIFEVEVEVSISAEAADGTVSTITANVNCDGIEAISIFKEFTISNIEDTPAAVSETSTEGSEVTEEAAEEETSDETEESEVIEEVVEEAGTEDSEETDETANEEDCGCEAVVETNEVTTEEEAVVEEIELIEPVDEPDVEINIIYSTDEDGYVITGSETSFSADVGGLDVEVFYWEFGDGEDALVSGPQNTVTHSYLKDGNYTLSLAVKDTDGNSYNTLTLVHVSDHDPGTTEWFVSSDAVETADSFVDGNTSENPVTVSSVLEKVVDGDTVYFLPGVYGAVYSETSDTSIDLNNIGTGTEENPISFIGYDDAVFDGGGILDYAFSLTSPLSYLGFYNFNFINYIVSAIFVNNEDITNIDIVDNTFSGNGTAIDAVIDSNLNILNNIIEDNDVGINVSADDVNIIGNIIRNNGQDIIVDGSKENIVVEDNGPLTVIRVVETDKEDYGYGEQVIITGSGYEPFQEIILKILRPDGTFVDSIYITTDENGNFTYDGYSVDYAGKDYLIEITDTEGSILEVLSFTDDTYVNVYLHDDHLNASSTAFEEDPDDGGLCGQGYAVIWHFILNQVEQIEGISVPATLTVNFVNAGEISGIAPTKVLKKVQHFYVGTYTEDQINGVKLDNFAVVTATSSHPQADANLILSHVTHCSTGSIELTKTGLGEGIAATFELLNVGPDGVKGGSDDISYGEESITGLASGNPIATWSPVPIGTGYYITETDVPPGYSRMADIDGISITTNGETVQVSGDNTEEETGQITVSKTGLEGSDTAIFTLYWVDNPAGESIVGTITLDNATSDPSSDGWTNLPYGTYRVVESYPASGNVYTYTTDLDSTATYSINADNTSETISVVNTPETGQITVSKTGLEGSDTAIFTLYLVNSSGPDTPMGTITLDNATSDPSSDGWTNLPYGTYRIEESYPASGNVYTYTTDLNSTDTYIINTDNTSETISVVNTPELGSLTINKYDGTTQAPLVAEFVLYESDGTTEATDFYGNTINPITTTGGTAIVNNLAYGTYYLVETVAPSGYVLDSTPREIVIPDSSGKINVVENVYNTPVGSITVTKTGLQGSDTAIFELFLVNSSGPDTSMGTITLNNATSDPSSDGWTDLQDGTYRIVESYPASGNVYTYTTDLDSTNTYSINETINVVNTPETGQITVTKTGLEGSDTAIFTLYLVNYSGPDTPMGTITLDNTTSDPSSDGWTNLPYGTYRVVESYPASGNVYTYTTDLDSTATYSINADNTSETISVVNTPETGQITVSKTGLEGSDTAIFTLYLVVDPSDPDNDILMGTITLDNTTSDPSSDGWTNLPYGTYRIEEGYPIGNVYTYTTDLDSTATYSIDAGNTSETISVVNTPELGSITVNKSGLDEGDTAAFKLYNSSGQVGVEIVVSAANPTKYWDGLAHGDYWVVESTLANYGTPTWTINPGGVTGSGNRIPDTGTFTIGDNSLDITIAVTNYHCSITVIKSGLSGSDTATFTLYDSKDNPVQSPIIVSVSSTTGTWTGLDWGDYYVVESTLTGYGTPTWTINPGGVTGTGNRMPGGSDMITISVEESDFTISIINTKKTTPPTGSITLNKTGLASTAIAGFTLYNSSGAAVVPEKTVTGSGSVSWGGLPYGTYYIVETTVPAGYAKMADVTSIVIGPGTMAHSFTRSNTTGTKTTLEVLGISELPFTGMDPFIPISGMAMMIVGVVMTVLSVIRRRKWKHAVGYNNGKYVLNNDDFTRS